MRKTSEAARVIRREYGNDPNFMTPHREGFYLLRSRNGHVVAAELSSGGGIFGGTFWGVSIAKQYPDGHTRRGGTHVSQCFNSRRQAMSYIERLTVEE
jgi:hypothetical protein